MKSVEPPVVSYGGTVTICLSVAATSTPKADVAWILDVTGSMGGSISNIIANITAFTGQLASSGINYQNGLVAYRDVNNPDSMGYDDCTDAPIQTFDFTPNDSQFIAELNSLTATGGGDLPESTLEGLNAAVNPTGYCGTPVSPLTWRPDASHTLIVVTDAPVHSSDYVENGATYSALSMLGFPVALHKLGYTIDVISNDFSATCGACSPTYIASEAGGLWLSIGASSGSWGTFMTTLGASVGQLTNVLLEDPLPPELAPVSGGAAGESVVGNQVYFNIPSLNVNGTPTPLVVCFPAVVTSDTASFIQNTASFSADGVTAISSNSVSVWNIGPTPTATPTDTPTLSPTATCTFTPTVTDTFTPTSTPTPTATNSPTSTPTCVPLVWPNPFNPKYAVDGLLKIGCLPPGSTVTVYTVSGEKVWSTSQSSASYGNPFTGTWDGRNRQGVPVAPGVYYYVIQAGDKVTESGKFLVVRGQ